MEIISNTYLSVLLIALAAIIGLGFGVFAIAKGTANEGVTNVQEGLQGVSDSAYTDYDQKVVTGTQVVSAYNNFEGKNVAVLVMTQATKDKALNKEATTNGLPSGNGVDTAYENASFKFADVLVEAALPGDTEGTYTTYTGVTTSKGKPVPNPVFINYNALLGSDEEANYGAYTSKKFIYFDTNCWRTTASFEAISGKVQFNNVSGNMSKSGMMEYVPSGARYQAYLIKDVSGTNMGVAFEQISSN